jgi:hypothetical protein
MASNNLPPVWRFDFGDYAGLGSIFQKFLANMNLFTLATYNALNGGIGFANMQRSIYKTNVTAAATTTLSFVNPLSIPPSGISVVYVALKSAPLTPITSAVSAANWFYDGKNINILSIPGLTSGSAYTISLEVM